MLLESGADPNVVISNGRTCLIKLVAREPKYYNEYHSDIAIVTYEKDVKDQEINDLIDQLPKFNDHGGWR